MRLDTMATLTKAQLFALFDSRQHAGISGALASEEIPGLAVYEGTDGKIRARPARTPDAPATDVDGGRLLGVYLKSRVRSAIRYMHEHPGTTPTDAARLFGISAQAVFVTLDRERRKQRNAVCPCCGQPWPKKEG